MPTGEIGPRPVTTTRDAGANSILVAASHCERLRTKFFLPSLVNAVDSRGMERKRNIEQYIRPPLMVYVGEVILPSSKEFVKFSKKGRALFLSFFLLLATSH